MNNIFTIVLNHIHLVACLFLSRKIQMGASSKSFQLIFSTDLEKIFCHSEHFVEKDKVGSHLVQGFVNIVDMAWRYQ